MSLKQLFKNLLITTCILCMLLNTTSCHEIKKLGKDTSHTYHKIAHSLKRLTFISVHKIKNYFCKGCSTVPLVKLAPSLPQAITFNAIPNEKDINAEYVFKNYPVNFDISALEPPTSEQIKTFINNYSLVRPIPYPYYSVLTVPSDACGSTMSDMYYTLSLIQRKYDLDLTSSFFPVLDYFNYPNSFTSQPSFISDADTVPLTHPVKVGTESIDNLPTFLTYYYRGWIDHLHGWSSEATSFISLLEPRLVSAAPQGNTQTLKPIALTYIGFDGLDIDFNIKGKINSFILKLVDFYHQEHYLAVGTKLTAEQQGWEFPLPDTSGDFHIYLPLEKELNIHPFNRLGKHFFNITQYFQTANLTVYGESTASVTLKMLRQVPYDRKTLAKQINLLQAYNIFPIATTNHGGTASWYQELPQVDEHTPVEYNNKKYSVHIPPMGSIEISPTHFSDLLNQFGLLFRSYLADSKHLTSISNSLTNGFFNSGIPYYNFPRVAPTPRPKSMPVNASHAENLGPLLAHVILQNNNFAVNRIIYTHFNFHNKEAFTKMPANAGASIHIADTGRLPPASEKVLTVLTELKHNRSGTIQPHQRIWVPSVSANMRYAAVLQQLNQHVKLTGNTIQITSWTDPVSGRQTPDINNPTLDLHGQTFYVRNAATAIVELDGHPLTALKRNPKDFTGRESVTVVDLTHPKLFFDKLNPLENHAAKIIDNSAELIFSNEVARIKERSDVSAGSRYASADTSLRSLIRVTDLKPVLKIISAKSGVASITIQPQMFDNYETDFLRFVLKKSRPDLHIFLGWKGNNQHFFLATEGDALNNSSHWKLPNYTDAQLHDYVVDYSDLTYAKNAPLPRGPVTEMQIGMLNAQPGDFIIVDRIEFLAAPGVKAEENGFVLGGRVLPAIDNIPVTLMYGKEKMQTLTERGGWYFFKKIPKDAIVEISANYNGKSSTPIRGRLLQAHRNDVEYHIKL